MAPVNAQAPDDPPWTRSIPFFLSSFPALSLSLSASSGSQMWQLQFTHSIAVLRMTSRKGTTRQKISQMSIIFMSEVGGSSSILLVKMVVITSIMVRFTAMASPNKSLSNKIVTKVMLRMMMAKILKYVALEVNLLPDFHLSRNIAHVIMNLAQLLRTQMI